MRGNRFERRLGQLDVSDPREITKVDYGEIRLNLWETIEDLLLKIRRCAEDSDDIKDLSRAVDVFLKSKRLLENDPAYLLTCINRLPAKDKEIFLSYLDKSNLRRDFKKGDFKDVL